MALLTARTVRCMTALILTCVFAVTACTQPEATPAVQIQPTPVDPLPSSTPTPQPTRTLQPTPSPTQNQTSSSFQGPLTVTITHPLDNETVQISPVEVSGQADPGTVVTINENVILVDNNRAFSLQLGLEPGANLIEITASDASDNQGFAYLTLYYDPQP